MRYEADYGEFVSSTSYFDREINETEDASEVQSYYLLEPFGYAPERDPLTEIKTMYRFVEEDRFTSAFKGPWQVVCQAYFSIARAWEYLPGFGYFPPNYMPNISAATGYPSDLVYYSNFPLTLLEPAAYGELSYQASEKLKFTVGARWYEIRATSFGMESGAAVGLVLHNR